jgi:two-component system nitrogen regulation response regulator NtrX
MTARVLVVDDEANLRRMLRALLEADGYTVDEAAEGEAGLRSATLAEPDVMLLDLVMPPGPDGITVLERLHAVLADTPVIMMSGKATLGDAVRATKLGAFQFLEKPLTPEAVLTAVRAAVDLMRARAENRALRAELPPTDEIIGDSGPMLDLKAAIAHVAPTATRVLITGESGTGKELVARAIHAGSPRHGRPMVSLNCAAIPHELVESELFGHERGAFTGAVQRRRGRFELADGSTLFLDEIGDLPLDLQAKLLRVLEQGTIERVGGERPKPVDVRVIAATNRDPAREVAAERFRRDLFFRLNVFPVAVPPLRERTEDIPALVRHFARLAGARSARPPRVFDAGAIARLQAHRWPGNVRELANLVERVTIMGRTGTVDRREIETLLGHEATPEPTVVSGSLADALDRYERKLIRNALERAEHCVAEAARLLQTDRANLYRRMRRLGLSRNDTDTC